MRVILTLMKILKAPYRDYLIIAFTLIAITLDFLLPQTQFFLITVAVAGSLETAWNAIESLIERKISIDTFNIFALLVSFATGEIASAAFIVLMLAVASILNWRTASRSQEAIKELLKLKPLTALCEKNGVTKEISAKNIRKGDILIVKSGARIPADGMVIFGNALVNESSVSGESALVQKIPGDIVASGTLNEEGIIKVRAAFVGKDSTLERMIALVREAQKHKSRTQKLADRFAAFFLPFVIVSGALTYYLTRNASMTAALFLIACADDIAVAIPLAMSAAIGRAAKRGVIIKGGQSFDALGKITALVIDKTGTLTYGTLAVQKISIEPHINEEKFWRALAVAEKFSEHPIARAVMHEATKHVKDIPDPAHFTLYKGSGVVAVLGTDEIIVGSERIIEEARIPILQEIKNNIAHTKETYGHTTSFLFINNVYAGFIALSDIPRNEAKESVATLKKLGIGRIIMFTGDNSATATRIANQLGIEEFRASMTPEQKLRELEELTKKYIVGMVGDGINDAPSLARAHVGIAMGSTGTAVAVESADIVILSDDLSRIPEMVILARSVQSVVRGDIVIWFITNAVGFWFVLSGLAGPALAAFYNFITDFLPPLNSARLFKKKSNHASA